MVTPGTFIEREPAGGDVVEMPMAALRANKPIWPLHLKQVIHTDLFRMKTVLKLIQTQHSHQRIPLYTNMYSIYRITNVCSYVKRKFSTKSHSTSS